MMVNKAADTFIAVSMFSKSPNKNFNTPLLYSSA